jgi:hypothetical protein
VPFDLGKNVKRLGNEGLENMRISWACSVKIDSQPGPQSAQQIEGGWEGRAAF